MRKKWWKKAIAVVASAIITLTGIPMLAISASAEVADWTGYTAISTKAELNAVRNNLSGNFYLTGDIVFSEADFLEGGDFYNVGVGWDSIGNESNPFTGIFDGNGCTISGLYMYLRSNSLGCSGLFGYNMGTIRNLGMVDGSINSFESDVGAIAGYSSGTISNCYNTGSVIATAGAYVGGIVGLYYDGTVSNCYNTGNVNATNAYSRVGGITGRNRKAISNCRNTGNVNAASSSTAISSSYSGGISGENTSAITNCYNTGNVTMAASAASSSVPYYAGGIAGYNGEYDSTISNCYNTGSVSAVSSTSSYAGGIAGYNRNSTIRHSANISNCYNTGGVSAISFSVSSRAYAGGIVGYNDYLETIGCCYNLGNVSTDATFTYAGGITGNTSGTINSCYYLDSISVSDMGVTNTGTKCSLEQMKNQATFINFDFSNDWMLSSQAGYSFPTLQQVPHIEGAENTTAFEGGNGTTYNPYKITTKEQLDAVRNYPGANYSLLDDIAFTSSDFAENGTFWNDGSGWRPIGTNFLNPFFGLFNGNGHTISGLYINIQSSSTVYAGLFGYSNGTILNLGVVDGSVTAAITDSSYVGGIVGYNGANTISNCYNTVSVTVTSSSSSYTGGIAGYNSGTICNCYNTGSVYASSSSDTFSTYAGGIVGYNDNIISNCYNTERVNLFSTSSSSTSSFSAYAGGIAGENYGTISNCYNTGRINADSTSSSPSVFFGTYVGGIAGENDNEISNCYNTGRTNATSTSSSTSEYVHYTAYAGGIAGYNIRTISNCYFLDNISDGNGSSIKPNNTKCTSLEQMKQQATFEGFDFSAVWVISSQAAYPLPTLQQVPLTQETPLFVLGNINGDTSVDLKDVTTLGRYLAGWQDVTVTEEELDVNTDGEIELKDLTLLSRYIAGWNFTIQ